MRNKINLFIQDNILVICVLLYVIVFIGLILGKERIPVVNEIANYIFNDITKYLATNDSAMVTVATVFIGIYFSVYTILTNISLDSAFAKLSYHNKQLLLKILNIGFISSFMYTLSSIFFPSLYSYSKCLSSFIILGLLLIIFISALEFGFFISIIIKKDIDGSIKNIDTRREQEIENDKTMEELRKYLHDERMKEYKKKNKDQK